jgi:uncharacterized protein (DUF1697 family)
MMPAVICLLRGVNVGGNNKLKMDALRSICESLKLGNVQTYIQSGNVVFTAPGKDLPALAGRLESAIEKSCGFRPDVVLRTLAEMRAVVAQNPFSAREGLEPGKLVVTFFDADGNEKIKLLKVSNEELRPAGRELYIYFPNGQGQSKMSFASYDRAPKIKWTGRNWNTVTKLVEMAASLET